jgi:FHS family L-fucose permease-like MFS transporter
MKRPPLLYMIYFIYFFCGMTLCFEGVFLPEIKEYFKLNYQEQMYTMFAKNIPFVLAVGIGYLLRYVGYKRCLTIAMALFSAGTLLLIPGLRGGQYGVMLLGFLTIGIGFNFQLVAGNPLLSALGPAKDASSRLNLGNALGAFAQIIAPATISFIIPAAVVTVSGKLPYIEALFLVLGTVLAGVSLSTLAMKDVDISASFQAAGAAPVQGNLWSHPRAVLGFVAIFLVLGTEAGLFGFYRNYLEDPAIAGLTARESQRMFTVYFAVFALGRMVASWVQKKVSPSTHVIYHLLGAMACLAVAVFAKGIAAVAAVTAIGFFVSILFPTLYAIAIENMGDLTGQVSGLLTMGFVGCALLPVLQGKLADTMGLQPSYAIGFVAYLFAVLYVVRYRRRPKETKHE